MRAFGGGLLPALIGKGGGARIAPLFKFTPRKLKYSSEKLKRVFTLKILLGEKGGEIQKKGFFIQGSPLHRSPSE